VGRFEETAIANLRLAKGIPDFGLLGHVFDD
jgi:hypothetical protein